MELRQFRYFLKAKELLNFTEAANQLFISQSTLSQQIKQLENELGMPLFNRVGKRVTITEAGEMFSDYALQSVNRANDGRLLLRELNNLNIGSLYIGVTYALRNLLTKVLVKFAEKYRNIKIFIVFGTTDELIEKLSQSKLDFILTFSEANIDSNFKYDILLKSPMTLVISKNSELVIKKSITIKEIISLPLALPASGYSTIQFINQTFKKSNLHPESSIEINDIPTLLELVKTGNWHTILTQISVNDENLTTIPITGKNMLRTAVFISLKDAYVKSSVKQFCKILKDHT